MSHRLRIVRLLPAEMDGNPVPDTDEQPRAQLVNHPDDRGLVVIEPPAGAGSFALNIEDVIKAIALVCQKRLTVNLEG